MMKSFKEIVSEVAQPISQGEKNFKDLHIKADNRDLVPGVTDQDFLFKGRPHREDAPTASYEDAGSKDDESTKQYDKTLKREEVEQVNEKIETTHENPLVTVHDKDGLHTHANLSTANKIFNTNVKHTDVHKGDVMVTSGHKDKNKLKFAISKHHATRVRKLTKEEVEQVDEISKATLGSYITKAASDIGTSTGAAAAFGSSSKSPDPKKMGQYQAKAAKRSAGLQKAVSKLTQEEAEQVDEISDTTLKSYRTKAMQHSMGHQPGDSPEVKADRNRKTANRSQGVRTSWNKMIGRYVKVGGGGKQTYEEVEHVDEMNSALVPQDHHDAQKMTSAEIKAKHQKYLDTEAHHRKRMKDMSLTSNQRMASSTVASAAKMAAAEWKSKYMKEEVKDLDEKTLTSAEMKKREEVVKAIKRGNPKMDKAMAYAIATKTAKRVAEDAQKYLGPDSKIKDNKHHNTSDYVNKNVRLANQRNSVIAASIKHDCAKHVAHEEWGVGTCIPEAHTIVETSNGEGYVSHYDIVFDHGVELNVPAENLNILVSESHEHARKNMREDIDYDYEGEMARAELEAICDKSRALADMMEDDMQLEAWLQSKITKAKYMIDSVYDYLMYSNRNQAGTGPTPSTVTPAYNQSAAMTDTYGTFLNRMGEEVDLDEAMSSAEKKNFADLAHPKGQVTYADKIVGAKLQAAKEKARRGRSEDNMEKKEDMKEDNNLSIISDEEKAKLENIMKAE